MCEVSVYCLIILFELHIKFCIGLCVFDFIDHNKITEIPNLDMFIFIACKTGLQLLSMNLSSSGKSFNCTFA